MSNTNTTFKTVSGIWDPYCFVEEEGMDWWDRWTAEDEANALWVAEADAYTMREQEEEAESEARIAELIAEWNSAMAKREAEVEVEVEMGAEAEEWLWAEEGKWLQAQAKAVLELAQAGAQEMELE